MPLYAVTICGVPARILPNVLIELRQRYSDRHTIQGVGARLYDDGLARYTSTNVPEALQAAANAVFGKSARPWGFCRNAHRQCALTNSRQDSCAKSETQSCGLKRPDFLFVLYQEGENEQELLSGLHHAALVFSLPRGCYNKRNQTIEAAVAAITRGTDIAGRIRASLTSKHRSLLLPPLNFDNPALVGIFVHANRGDDLRESLRRFGSEYFRREYSSFKGRLGLGFKPATSQGQHGAVSDEQTPELALTKSYRLGCQYDGSFHWDVSRLDGKHLDNRITLRCRRSGARCVHGPYVNLTVDDCIR
jgi:hypothetical protein